MTTPKLRGHRPLIQMAVALGLSLCGVGRVCFADIELNRLNACDDVAAIASELRAGIPPHSSDCRPPSGAIERNLYAALSPMQIRACFLRQPPKPSLSDFACTRMEVSGSALLTCYRAVPVTSINEYKAKFGQRYAVPVAQYLSQSTRCPASNGDASQAGSSLFPNELALISAFEFGYISQLGTTHPGDVTALHGFAKTAPELVSAGVEALEYVAYFTSAVKQTEDAAPQRRTRVGHWLLEMDDAATLDAEFGRLYRRFGAAITINSLIIDIERAPDAPAYSSDRQLSEALGNAATDGFVNEGFDEISEEELEESTGMTSLQMLAEVGKRVPFGQRGIMAHLGSNPRVTVLIKSRGAPCTRENRGLFAIYVMRDDGVQGVQVDFGSVGIFVLGWGACGGRSTPLLAYTGDLLNEAKQAVLKEIESH